MSSRTILLMLLFGAMIGGWRLLFPTHIVVLLNDTDATLHTPEVQRGAVRCEASDVKSGEATVCMFAARPLGREGSYEVFVRRNSTRESLGACGYTAEFANRWLIRIKDGNRLSCAFLPKARAGWW